VFKIDSVLDIEISKSSYIPIGYLRSSSTHYYVLSTGYIFWRDENFSYVQKIAYAEYPKEELFLFEPLKIKENILLDFFSENKSILLSESELKPFEHNNKGWKNGVFSTGRPSRVHGFKGRIKVNSGNYIYARNIDYSYLDKKWNDDEHINVNYEFNQNLKLTEFDKKVNIVIDSLETQNSFKIKS
jgi:hypothetical protein